MDPETLHIVDASLQRCSREARFLDLFYAKFLASSPKVQARFAGTNLERQKRALRGSLWVILLAAENEEKGPETYLASLAEMHSSRHLDIGAELYDLWLDNLLAAVAECDPEHTPQVRSAWERVMMVGIHYMVTRYNR